MNYNHTNRSSLVAIHTVVPSIDRIKVTFQIRGKTPMGYPNSILVDNFTRLPHVKKDRKLEYGIYFVYKDTDGTEHLEFILSWSLDKGEGYAETIKPTLKTPQRKITRNNRVCYYTGYTKTLSHYEYRVIGWNKRARIIRNKNYLMIELNDVLQQYPEKKPYKLVREALEYMLKVNILKLNVKQKNIKSIRRKAYRLMKKLKISEVEVAFDIDSTYGKLLSSKLLRLSHKKLGFNKYKNTIYWDNSFQQSRRWKFKLYNRSLKDRKDIYIDELRKTHKGLSKIELSGLVPEQIEEEKFDDDIYRFEITLGRNRLNELEDLAFLKHKSMDMILLLNNLSYAGLSKFIALFDYQDVKDFIERLKGSLSENQKSLIENTTKKNYKRLLSSVLCKYKPVEVYRRHVK